jgi:hypothetical protein
VLSGLTQAEVLEKALTGMLTDLTASNVSISLCMTKPNCQKADRYECEYGGAVGQVFIRRVGWN